MTGTAGPRGTDLRARASRALRWSVGQIVGGQVLTTVAFVLMVRALDPEAFGLFALASIYLGLVRPVVTLGIDDAIAQREQLVPAHLDGAFRVTLASGLGFLLVGLAMAALLSRRGPSSTFAPVLAVLTVDCLFHALRTVPEGLLRREMRFDDLAVRTLAASLVGGLLGVALALTGYGVWALVGQRLGQSAAAALAVWHATEWRPSGLGTEVRTWDLLWFGGMRTAARVVTRGTRGAVDGLIGLLMGTAALGHFSVADRLVRAILRAVSFASTQVSLPALSELQAEPARLRAAYGTVGRLAAVVGLPFFALFAIAAPDIVPQLFGAEWHVAGAILVPLSVFGAATYFRTVQQTFLLAIGRAGVPLAAAALVLAGALVVVPSAHHLGIVTVAWLLSLPHLVALALVGFLTVRRLGVAPQVLLEVTLPPAATALLGCLAYVGLEGVTAPLAVPAAAAVRVGAALAVFAASTAVLSPATSRDVVTLLSAQSPCSRGAPPDS